MNNTSKVGLKAYTRYENPHIMYIDLRRLEDERIRALTVSPFHHFPNNVKLKTLILLYLEGSVLSERIYRLSRSFYKIFHIVHYSIRQLSPAVRSLVRSCVPYNGTNRAYDIMCKTNITSLCDDGEELNRCHQSSEFPVIGVSRRKVYYSHTVVNAYAS